MDVFPGVANSSGSHIAVAAPLLKKHGFGIAQLEAIVARCAAKGIPRPVSFAYPGKVLDKDVLPLLH
jgi:hypothetical protein